MEIEEDRYGKGTRTIDMNWRMGMNEEDGNDLGGWG
jgi:hypothetical protein